MIKSKWSKVILRVSSRRRGDNSAGPSLIDPLARRAGGRSDVDQSLGSVRFYLTIEITYVIVLPTVAI